MAKRLPGQEPSPPPNLVKLVAHRESETEAERNQYLYRQTVALDELDDRGATRGHYREVRDVIFSPSTTAPRNSSASPKTLCSTWS